MSRTGGDLRTRAFARPPVHLVTVPPPRVRFAPSPSGYLHVGGARTALFNWLFARGLGGVFVLRIEDTDAGRSSIEMAEGIVEGLRWLGLDWDEGPLCGGPHEPYFQSQRFAFHRQLADRLLASGAAYYCYCSQEELAARRQTAEQSGGGWIYDRTCRALTAEQISARDASGQPKAVRLAMPAGVISFDDIVHGTISFDSANIEDFIIVRSDGTPTYNLSVVSDDVEMRITHVIRGDDHISNTPKQIAIYQALGEAVPQFAHVPMILGADKKRLSKRHGATSVGEYEKQGFLPEAMLNFLALLGWSPGSGDRELFSRDELIEAFGLEGITGSDAVFNPEKLGWFNQQHMARLPAAEVAARLQPWFERAGIWDAAYAGDRRDWFLAVIEQLKPRAVRLDEFATLGRFFFDDTIQMDGAAVEKHVRPAVSAGHLEAVVQAFSRLDVFDAAATETLLRGVAAERGVKAATLIHAVRVALTGRTVSPGLFDVCALLGRSRTLERLRNAIRLSSEAS